MPWTLSKRCFPVAVFAIASTIAPATATAASAPSTRLVACPSGSCLLVKGHRASPAATVSINGHVVPVAGQRDWQARLPLSTVRDWSMPLARRITITTQDAKTAGNTVATADLPIGLLGHSRNLAVLVIGGR